MKIKMDFVTNSSSASFMLYVMTDDDNVLSFIDRMMKNVYPNIAYEGPALFSSDKEDNGCSLKQGVEMLSKGVFVIHDWTSMYNYNMDIPEYMRALILDWKINQHTLLSMGIKDVVFKSLDDH